MSVTLHLHTLAEGNSTGLPRYEVSIAQISAELGQESLNSDRFSVPRQADPEGVPIAAELADRAYAGTARRLALKIVAGVHADVQSESAIEGDSRVLAVEYQW